MVCLCFGDGDAQALLSRATCGPGPALLQHLPELAARHALLHFASSLQDGRVSSVSSV